MTTKTLTITAEHELEAGDHATFRDGEITLTGPVAEHRDGDTYLESSVGRFWVEDDFDFVSAERTYALPEISSCGYANLVLEGLTDRPKVFGFWVQVPSMEEPVFITPVPINGVNIFFLRQVSGFSRVQPA